MTINYMEYDITIILEFQYGNDNILQIAMLPNGRDGILISNFEVTVLGKKITVERGFITDFASSPWWAWSIVPPTGRYSPAAVIHDNIYRHKKFSRKLCDKIFLQMMVDLNVKKWRRNLMYGFVRVGGWTRFGKPRKVR